MGVKGLSEMQFEKWTMSDVHGDEHYLSNSTGLNFFQALFSKLLK